VKIGEVVAQRYPGTEERGRANHYGYNELPRFPGQQLLARQHVSAHFLNIHSHLIHPRFVFPVFLRLR
jgi:hypothetical protein